ncbi:MAG: hypothetical protein IJ493_06365 [Clostridia bacterium]|nr:hypothetical protein [Clostridia bacterium]
MIGNYLLLVLSVSVSVLGSSVNNHFSKEPPDIELTKTQAAGGKFLYNVFASAAAMLVVAFFGGSLAVSPVTLGLGVLFGLCNGFSMISRTFALAEGPMSLTLLIASCGMLIPTFAGVIFWQESVSLPQGIGVALMILALVLIMNVGVDGKLSVKWCLLSFGAFLCTGFISILQKVQQSSAYPEQRGGFLLVSFAVAFLMNGGMAAFCLRGHSPNLRRSVSGLATGCCNGANHMLNLYLSGVIPAVIFFPLVNGGVIMLSGLVGMLFFREKCSRRQLAGFLLGVASILLIGGIFG